MGNTDLILQWSKLIPLNEKDIKNLLLENIEGVYRISKKEADGKFYVVFVGSTLNLGNQLISMLSTEDFLKQDANFVFRYAPIKGEDMRKAIEKQMYKQYAPEYNPKEPDSSLDVKANLN